MVSSILTSTITVGFGGSAGLEGPTIGTSAAIASNIAQYLRMDRSVKTLLLGCAAAGAMAAIFKAPVAAIVFAVEVIMLDLTTASLIPLLLASISAFFVSSVFLGDDTLFHVTINEENTFTHIPFYVGLGILAGGFSVYFSKVFIRTQELFEKIKNRKARVLIGGIILGVLIFMMPVLYGEGYDMINSFIADDPSYIFSKSPFYNLQGDIPIFIALLVAIMFFKAIATSATFGAGGVGGIFAPSLFLGSALGYGFASAFNALGFAKLSTSNFTLVGMGGVMAGILQAPLTAVFLIAEITGGYGLFIPLMITGAIAFITVKTFLPHTVYTMQLAKRGELLTHDKDQAVLTLMNLENEIEDNFETINAEANLGDLVKAVSKSNRNLFPVLSPDKILIGVITLDEIRDIMFDQSKYEEVKVFDLMVSPPEIIFITDSMEMVMQKFENSKAWNLPVTDGKKYVGFVSKSRLFSAYRELLKDFTLQN